MTYMRRIATPDGHGIAIKERKYDRYDVINDTHFVMGLQPCNIGDIIVIRDYNSKEVYYNETLLDYTDPGHLVWVTLPIKADNKQIVVTVIQADGYRDIQEWCGEIGFCMDVRRTGSSPLYEDDEVFSFDPVEEPPRVRPIPTRRRTGGIAGVQQAFRQAIEQQRNSLREAALTELDVAADPGNYMYGVSAGDTEITTTRRIPDEETTSTTSVTEWAPIFTSNGTAD